MKCFGQLNLLPLLVLTPLSFPQNATSNGQDNCKRNINLFKNGHCYARSIFYERAESFTVRTKYGAVRGAFVENVVNISASYYSFRGIPYASPPLGKLRFQPPEAPPPWNDVLSATANNIVCLQFNNTRNSYQGQEDCLFLNVFTRHLPQFEGEKFLLRPVLFFIHGGGFYSGSGGHPQYGPEFLIEHDIVIVSFNYRLGIFGFLSSGDEYASGNAGLKDQVAALEWVRDNIQYFGGDPKSVTIYGHSSGSASVMYLMQAQRAAGLFHKAIASSGSSLSTWAYQHQPKETFERLCNFLNISTNSTPNAIQALQDMDAGKLFLASAKPQISGFASGLSSIAFAPCLEKASTTALITESSFLTLKSGNFSKTPLLMGYTNSEGLCYFALMLKGAENIFDLFDSEILVPTSLNIPRKTAESILLSHVIRQRFFGFTYFLNMKNLVKFLSSTAFIRPILKSVELMREHIPVYLYEMHFKGSYYSFIKGVVHSEEKFYLWYSKQRESPNDQLNRQRMTTLWTNFVKYGSPTPVENDLFEYMKWGAVTRRGDFECFRIDRTLSIGVTSDLENYKFWNQIFSEYGKPPFNTW